MAENQPQGPGDRTVTAAMIVIGNEILSGRVQDKNLNFIATRLNALGIRLTEARVVIDQRDAIVKAVNETRAAYDYVFTSGGIGPTHDDITADSVAAAFGVGIDHNPEAVAILEAHYQPGMLNEARLRMARIPDGAALVENPVSHAPGFRLENVYVFAGIPSIMQAMFESIRHQLIGGAPIQSIQVTSYLPEGVIAGPLGAIQADFPDLDMGSYPFYRGQRFGTTVVFRGTDEADLNAAAEAFRDIVRQNGQEPIDGEVR
jgi:molybdenum cofactor synthesis domain-containing protein